MCVSRRDGWMDWMNVDCAYFYMALVLSPKQKHTFQRHHPPHQMAKAMDGARARDLSLQKSWAASFPNYRPEVDHE